MMILEQIRQKQQVSDPFLWAHVALLAALPLTLVLTMAGLAVGDPVFPGWMEMPILGIPIVAYGIWLQWKRPLFPFSLWAVSKPPECLNALQTQILSIVKRPSTGWISVVAGVFLYVTFRQIYLTAPLATPIAPFPPFLRFLGIIWALVFFLKSNMILQMGVVAARVLILPASELQGSFPIDHVKDAFTIVGIPKTSLWQFESSAPPSQPIVVVKPEVPSEAPSPIAVSPPPAETPQETKQEVPPPTEPVGLPEIPDLVFPQPSAPEASDPTTEEGT